MMHQTTAKTGKQYRTLTASAMFAAMIALTTAYLFHLPVGANGGYIHFGDAFIYLAAALLPLPYAAGAALIGGGLADLMSGALIWMLPTMVIKPLGALAMGKGGGKIVTPRRMVGLVLAGAITMGGYYLAEVFIVGSWVAPLAMIGSNAIQALGSALVFLLVGTALDKAGIPARLGLSDKKD